MFVWIRRLIKKCIFPINNFRLENHFVVDSTSYRDVSAPRWYIFMKISALTIDSIDYNVNTYITFYAKARRLRNRSSFFSQLQPSAVWRANRIFNTVRFSARKRTRGIGGDSTSIITPLLLCDTDVLSKRSALFRVGPTVVGRGDIGADESSPWLLFILITSEVKFCGMWYIMWRYWRNARWKDGVKDARLSRQQKRFWRLWRTLLALNKCNTFVVIGWIY